LARKHCVFSEEANPATDRPYRYVNRKDKLILLRSSRYKELSDGSLQRLPSADPATAEYGFTDGDGGGQWRKKHSGGMPVMQLDRKSWPLAASSGDGEPVSNGYPQRMHLYKEREEARAKLGI
jgi:hypothetical protein